MRDPRTLLEIAPLRRHTRMVQAKPEHACDIALPGVICVVIAAFHAEAGFVAFAVLLAPVGLVLALMLRLLKAVTTTSPRPINGCRAVR